MNQCQLAWENKKCIKLGPKSLMSWRFFSSTAWPQIEFLWDGNWKRLVCRVVSCRWYIEVVMSWLAERRDSLSDQLAMTLSNSVRLSGAHLTSDLRQKAESALIALSYRQPMQNTRGRIAKYRGSIRQSLKLVLSYRWWPWHNRCISDKWRKLSGDVMACAKGNEQCTGVSGGIKTHQRCAPKTTAHRIILASKDKSKSRAAVADWFTVEPYCYSLVVAMQATPLGRVLNRNNSVALAFRLQPVARRQRRTSL